jgi:hypothetical protein
MVKIKYASPKVTKSSSAKTKAEKASDTPNGRVRKLRRFTNLAAAIHLLQTRKITLLNPASWDDKNDAHFMAEYKRLRKMQTVLAICFASPQETYHHWRVFSNGADGICISFDRKRLLDAFKKQPGMTMGKMRYEYVETVAAWPELKVAQLPFLKRKPYQAENEYRVIYESADKPMEFFDVDIDLAWIKAITLSPWMPPAFLTAVKTTLRAIPGCEHIEIVRSTLVGRESWQSLTARAAD